MTVENNGRVDELLEAVESDNRMRLEQYNVLDDIAETHARLVVGASERIEKGTGVNGRKDMVITNVEEQHKYYYDDKDEVQYTVFCEVTVVCTHVDDLYPEYEEVDVVDCRVCGRECIKKSADVVLEEFERYSIVLKSYECYREQCYNDSEATVSSEKVIQFAE